jgi:hypothetical protein
MAYCSTPSELKGGSGLVDLLVARRRSLGTHLDRRAHVFQPEVVRMCLGDPILF